MGRAQGGGHSVQALASADSSHGADRWRGGNRGDDPRGVRRSSKSSSSATAASGSSGGSNAASIFGSSKTYKFTFVNHVTTNPFFTPTQNGAADACKLLGCSYQWTGSQTSNVSEMVNAMNSAISAGVNGIGVALIDLHAFNAPTDKALQGRRSRSSRTTPTPRATPARVHRPGPVRLRPGDGQAHRRRSCRRATSRCSSPRRARSTSSRGSTARWTR